MAQKITTKVFLLCAVLFCTAAASAQNFIDSGAVEYEVRVNLHKSLGDDGWAATMKDRVPQFSSAIYRLTFTPRASFYTFVSRDEKAKLPWDNSNEEDNIWYKDLSAGTFQKQRNIFDDIYLLTGSLGNAKWKLYNENRDIAGFNCRKASTIINDSIYVFAYYTEEIPASTGPMNFGGLPGAIMGITIPRLFTSIVANKVMVNGVNYGVIKPPSKGKKQEATTMLSKIAAVTKDWGKWGQQAAVNAGL